MSLSKELIKGSSAMLVLGVLDTEPMYGYGIIKELERRSENVFSMKEGTLYPILHSLEQEKLVESYWEETESARKRKYYRITDKGRSELQKHREEFEEYAVAVRKIMGGAVSCYV